MGRALSVASTAEPSPPLSLPCLEGLPKRAGARIKTCSRTSTESGGCLPFRGSFAIQSLRSSRNSRTRERKLSILYATGWVAIVYSAFLKTRTATFGPAHLIRHPRTHSADGSGVPALFFGTPKRTAVDWIGRPPFAKTDQAISGSDFIMVALLATEMDVSLFFQKMMDYLRASSGRFISITPPDFGLPHRKEAWCEWMTHARTARSSSPIQPPMVFLQTTP